MTFDLKELCVPPDYSIRQVVACIDRNGKGIALITDEGGRLLDTVTDGDVRRALLINQDMDAPVSDLLRLKPVGSNAKPITAPVVPIMPICFN